MHAQAVEHSQGWRAGSEPPIPFDACSQQVSPPLPSVLALVLPGVGVRELA
jgi:hypothetical protein